MKCKLAPESKLHLTKKIRWISSYGSRLWATFRVGKAPGGFGRPGWHIECSAMAWKHLGETFDIHAGGIDLVFPHHENEVAQTCCALGVERMANYWLHNGFLQVEGQKMSKSLGNFKTIHDQLGEWPGEALRLAMLATHYRQPINWTADGVREAKRILDSWREHTVDVEASMDIPEGLLKSLCDDLNTPQCIAVLHELRRDAAKGVTGAADLLKAGAGLLGLLQTSQAEWDAWRPRNSTIDDQQVEDLIVGRKAARDAKNWAGSGPNSRCIDCNGRGLEGRAGRHKLGAGAIALDI